MAHSTTAPLPTASFTYTQPGTRTATLRVTDPSGATGTSSVTISAGNTPPTAVIDTPAARHDLEGRRHDQLLRPRHRPADRARSAASALTWSLVLQHCPSTCHEHPLQTFAGTASGSFVAPDHEYPSHLELRLTATDPGGLSQHDEPPTRPADRGSHVRIEPGRADTGRRVHQPAGAVHPDGDPGIDAFGQRTVATGDRGDRLRVRQLVGRWRGRRTTSSRTRPGRTSPPTGSGSAGQSSLRSPPGPARDGSRSRGLRTSPPTARCSTGATTAYGSATPLDRTLVTSHSMIITGLSRKASYLFQVLSRDGVGNLSSATGSFSTK